MHLFPAVKFSKANAMKPNDDEYKSVEYEPLSAVGARKHRVHTGILSFSAGSLATLLLAASVLAIKHFAFASPAPKSAEEVEAEEWNHCGRSSAVAMARGCVMEPLFYGWFPPQCVYSEVTEAYPVFEDRKYYEDFNLTKELRPEQLYAGEHQLIWTRKYHGEHCLYQWRKLQYAVTNQVEFIDAKTLSMGHETHCADQMSAGCETPMTVNRVELGFYRCKKAFWA